jgi:hypothetical protein
MTNARRGRWAFALASAAVIWAISLVPIAFLVPVYGTSASGDGTSGTLIAVNGLSPRLLVVIALPAVFALLGWIGLRRLCTRGASRGGFLATLAIVLLGALTLLTGFSVGFAMLPVLVLLLVARRLTPTGTPA